jgi:hypothetical protein
VKAKVHRKTDCEDLSAQKKRLCKLKFAKKAIVLLKCKAEAAMKAIVQSQSNFESYSVSKKRL